MMHAACSRPVWCEIRADPHMQFSSCTAGSHFIDLDAEFRLVRIRVSQGWPHAQDFRQKSTGRLQLRNRNDRWSQASDLMSWGRRAA
jgi:hypothetical protein